MPIVLNMSLPAPRRDQRDALFSGAVSWFARWPALELPAACPHAVVGPLAAEQPLGHPGRMLDHRADLRKPG